jgi:sugar-specific transcriptional regulator TrmB
MDLIAELLKIGLTVYEARVYLELLHTSPATGYQLSKNAGIPRSMVYEALGRLTARGLRADHSPGCCSLWRSRWLSRIAA